MGLITTDQSHQVMAVLATNVAWKEIDFEVAGLQDAIIRDPKGAGRHFTEFLKNIPRPIPIYANKLVSQTAKLLSKRFGKKITVDPLPDWFTEENLAKAAKFNLRPIFLPGEEIGQDRPLRNWVKPNDWFYRQIQDNKIAADSTYLKRGWYLADFTLGADYEGGTQVFQNDPLSPIIARLRQEGKIGKNDKTPPGSRFAILPKEEWPLLIAALVDEELKIPPCSYDEGRLERAIEFNAIGNLYDENRGKFNMWEWFAAVSGDTHRLRGGYRGDGGLTSVDCGWVSDRVGSFAGRPLVSF
ncbi:MAG: hypothetical protein UX30_C0023G0010 [Candidatus Saccharibacteria bacterium GW2011_GWA2_46_10]|nr:MAG: hypothetical protein UX30_C0023G0010 [Candidatus Saccharibacteria bacterium GW2011_GWA2_46_10]